MDLMPKPTLRKDGRWMLQMPRKAGKSRRCVYGRSPEECERRYLEAIGAGAIRVRPGSISEFVVESFDAWITPRVNADSKRRYDLTWRTHVGPAVGHLLFEELTPQAVQAAILGEGRSASAQIGAKNILGQIVNLGISLGRARVEHSMMVKLVRTGTIRPREREDMAAKAQAMLDAARRLGHWTEGFIWAAMTLGLRRGELSALKRVDVEEASGLLTIRRQRNHTMGERDVLKSRQAGSTRRIGLPREVLAQLLSYFRPGAIYLVTREDGSPPPPQHWGRYLAPVEEEAGVRMTPHDFRSAAICRLIDLGASDHAIMELVGHSSREMIAWYRDERSARTREALAMTLDR